MIRVAITGNIASGKSQVENYLKSLYPVVDTDAITHNLLEQNQNLIIDAFAPHKIAENGTISRKLLGALVFDNPELKTKLEDLLHPQIKTELQRFFAQHKDSSLVFASVPLLFEAKFEALFDKIIFIYAPDDIRLKRLMNRNNLSEQDATKRMNCQASQEEKLSKCDYVIKNDSSKEELLNKLNEILNDLSNF